MQTLRDYLSLESLGALGELEFPASGAAHCTHAGIPMAALWTASRFVRENRSILVVARDHRGAETWMENLAAQVGEENLYLFPALGLKPYEHKDPFEGVLEERLRFFQDLARPGAKVVVAPLDALCVRLPDPAELLSRVVEFAVGGTLEPEALRAQLLDMGFCEQPVVENVGDFSIRGCIVDLNPFLYEHPVRIELFGDEIESIRTFDIFNQRSLEPLQKVAVFPMGEFYPSRQVLEKLLPSEWRERVLVRGETTGLCWLRGLLAKLDRSLVDCLGDCALVVEDLPSVPDRVQGLWQAWTEAHGKAYDLGYAQAAPATLLWRSSEVSALLDRFPVLDFNRVQYQGARWTKLEVKAQERSASGLASIEDELLDYHLKGGRVLLVASTPGQALRLKHLADGLPVDAVLVGHLTEGFWLCDGSLAVLTDHQIFNRSSRRGRKQGVAASVQAAMLVETLNRGDFVIHQEHGVGRYMGLVRVRVQDAMVDCVLLEYAGKDRLTFPVGDLHKVERVPVNEEHVPELHKLGGKAWENAKSRVRQKVVQIARELVELYAKRELTPGFAFPPDGEVQTEFEADFEYEPTPDQATATADLKRDMERPRPMDRLVCGDVGFGKTEVAMRATFKCVSARKQVAVLVPTTVLAAQHFETFRERFSDWPVHIELVNRYKSPAEKKDIFKRLAEGKVDLVVGTHSLLSEKVLFHDLGLLVIDEEQKFGVKQKERLRELRLTVDTLSMSATPIPRTLHLSMTGVRDISLINTPPRNRLPVETRVLKRNDAVLADAVLDELARGGQVFVVNDRVNNILELADDVEKWAPEARVAVAHGQMDDHQLERVMSAFVNREFDILVSTSIIESGIDVPNANTIVIMNSHHFGMSQLYQMRGRVGRSSVHARAFLVTPNTYEISLDSQKRLQALEKFTDLGSGYQIAMRDLEIRGAGNLLGTEQHGFISEVGFETYVRMVREAVEELRGANEPVAVQPRVELGVDAYLPEHWIEDGLQRIAVYQRIARLAEPTQIAELELELRDRFGPLPVPAKMLLHVTEAGLWAARLRLQGLQQRQGMLALTFTEKPAPDPRLLVELPTRSPYPMRFLATTPLQAVVELGRARPEALAEAVVNALRAMNC
jgi:transcription-repair coupling factor (superfamily II helicase)